MCGCLYCHRADIWFGRIGTKNSLNIKGVEMVKEENLFIPFNKGAGSGKRTLSHTSLLAT